MSKKQKTDYFDYWHVEMSFIATQNALRNTNDKATTAVKKYIALCTSTNRPNSARIAAENRDRLQTKYKRWADKQNGVPAAVPSPLLRATDDLEVAAIELLQERGYTISKA